MRKTFLSSIIALTLASSGCGDHRDLNTRDLLKGKKNSHTEESANLINQSYFHAVGGWGGWLCKDDYTPGKSLWCPAIPGTNMCQYAAAQHQGTCDSWAIKVYGPEMTITDDFNQICQNVVAGHGVGRSFRYPTGSRYLGSLVDETCEARSAYKKVVPRINPVGVAIAEPNAVCHNFVNQNGSYIYYGVSRTTGTIYPLKCERYQARSGSAVVVIDLSGSVAPADPMARRGQHGVEVIYRVTALAPGAAGPAIYGTDVYSIDSDLAVTAVHAGVLAPGTTGNVRVRILQSPLQYFGSMRNGIRSLDWNNFYVRGAYEFVRQ